MDVSEFAKALAFLDNYIDFSCIPADTDDYALDSSDTSGKRTKTMYRAEVITTVIGALVKDSMHERCIVLHQTPKYLGKIYKGERRISQDNAGFIIKNQSIDDLAGYFKERLPDDDTLIYDLCKGLNDKGYTTDENSEYSIANSCALLIRDSIAAIIGSGDVSNDEQFGQSPLVLDAKAFANLEAALKALPQPHINLAVPPAPTPDERTYIEELYKAYADAEGIANIDETNIGNYEEYIEDLSDHRIEYFAAESIKRSLEEYKTKAPVLDNQFEVLKKEICQGIKPLIRMSYPNGYERLQKVMFETQSVPTDEYILSNTPHWISGEIKKGVCHFLVNEGKFQWVKKQNG